MCIELVKLFTVVLVCEFAIADNESVVETTTTHEVTNINRSKRAVYSIRIAEQQTGHFTVNMLLEGSNCTFKVLLDTATQRTWVPSSRFINSNRAYENIAGYTVQRNAKSHPLLGYKRFKQWGDVKILNTEVDDLCLINFYVNLIDNMDPIPDLFGEYEGVFGLAPNSGYLNQYQSFCSWLLAKQKESERIFTLWYPLGRQRNYGAAELGIGAIVPEHMHEPLIYFPVTTTGLWSIKVDRISLGDYNLCKGDCEVVFDSSIMEVLGERDKIVQAEASFWPKSGAASVSNVVNCNSLSNGPIFTVVANGHSFTWTMKETAIKVSPLSKLCKFGFLPDPRPLFWRWTFGSQLMWKLYTVFDVQNKRVGIARAKFPA